MPEPGTWIKEIKRLTCHNCEGSDDYNPRFDLVRFEDGDEHQWEVYRCKHGCGAELRTPKWVYAPPGESTRSVGRDG